MTVTELIGARMLETERLILRPFQENDYVDLHEYLSLEEIYRFEPGRPVSLEEAKKIATKRAAGEDFWAVTLKDKNRKLIGHISFLRSKPRNLLAWEIGYIFNPVFQNMGYCTEAVEAIISYAFKKLKAHRITAFCSPDNIPSWKILEKCGMTREGLHRKNIFFQKNASGSPIWLDSYSYAILAEDSK